MISSGRARWNMLTPHQYVLQGPRRSWNGSTFRAGAGHGRFARRLPVVNAFVLRPGIAYRIAKVTPTLPRLQVPARVQGTARPDRPLH